MEQKKPTGNTILIPVLLLEALLDADSNLSVVAAGVLRDILERHYERHGRKPMEVNKPL